MNTRFYRQVITCTPIGKKTDTLRAIKYITSPRTLGTTIHKQIKQTIMKTIEVTDKTAEMIKEFRSGKKFIELHDYVLNAISDTVEKLIDPQEAFLMMSDLKIRYRYSSHIRNSLRS